MGFLNNLLKRESTATAEATTTTSSTSQGASFGGDIALVASPKSALSVSAFYRAVELRSQTMSQLVMQYQKRNDRAHGGNYQQDNETRGGSKGGHLNYLVQVRPNPTMTWPQLVRMAEQMRIFKGNAVIYIERSDDGAPLHLWLCSAATYHYADGTYTLQYKTPLQVNLAQVQPYNVIHLRNTFSIDGGLTGIDTLTYAAKALTLAATNDKLVQDNASKGGKLKLIVQEEKQQGFGLGRANQKQLEKITNELNDDIYKQDVVLLNNIASVTPISQSMQQQEVQIARQFSVREIARYMGVPAIMLMDDSGSSYKTPEAATQEFLMRTIAPLANDWEVEFNSKILGEEMFPTFRFHFDTSSLMRLDPMGMANLQKIQLETGIKCVNELRADNDLPSVKDGDRHYISTNLAELGSDKLGQSAQPTAQKGDDQ